MRISIVKLRLYSYLSKKMSARIIWHLVRWISRSDYRKDWDMIFISHDWHRTVSVFLATYIYWIFWPLALLVSRMNIVFSINNISQSTGHFYIELDNLLRQQELGIIPREKKIICIFPKSPVTKGFKYIKNNDNLYNM